jgi:hypothetical protein
MPALRPAPPIVRSLRSIVMFGAPTTRPSPEQLSRSLRTRVLVVSVCPQETVRSTAAAPMVQV